MKCQLYRELPPYDLIRIPDILKPFRSSEKLQCGVKGRHSDLQEHKRRRGTRDVSTNFSNCPKNVAKQFTGFAKILPLDFLDYESSYLRAVQKQITFIA